MTVRAARSRPEGAVDVPVGDLLAMIRDPEHFDIMLSKLAQRIDEAGAAEAAAKEARDGAEAAKAQIETARQLAEEALERARAKHDQEMGELSASLNRTRDNLESRLAQLNARESALNSREADINDRHAVLVQNEKTVAAARASADEDIRKNSAEAARLSALAATLEDMERHLWEREETFKMRLRSLNADL